MTVEHTHFNHGAEVTRFYAQRCVTNVRGFLTKDGAQKFFFWCHRAFAFWCDLTDKNITWLYVRADVNDACLVEVAQRFFTNVWNIACDFFWA